MTFLALPFRHPLARAVSAGTPLLSPSTGKDTAKGQAVPRPGAALPVHLLLLTLWFAGALYAAANHTMWRDEIRAFSFAQRGSGLLDMVVAIRGDGHPALWHVILRLAWTAYRDPVVLPLAAFAIGAAGATLLALRAPFRPLLLALALLGAFTLYEYVAVARNYGLGVLLLYAIAAAWARHRDTPGVLAALLFLLANANIHSLVFAGALLLLWAVELLQQRARALPDSCPPDSHAWRSFALAVAATALGAALCLCQAYPSAQSAAMLPTERPGPLALLATLVLGLGPAFAELMPAPLRSAIPVIVILPTLIGLAIAGLRTPPAPGEPPHRWARDPALGAILHHWIDTPTCRHRDTWIRVPCAGRSATPAPRHRRSVAIRPLSARAITRRNEGDRRHGMQRSRANRSTRQFVDTATRRMQPHAVSNEAPSPQRSMMPSMHRSAIVERNAEYPQRCCRHVASSACRSDRHARPFCAAACPPAPPPMLRSAYAATPCLAACDQRLGRHAKDIASHLPACAGVAALVRGDSGA